VRRGGRARQRLAELALDVGIERVDLGLRFRGLRRLVDLKIGRTALLRRRGRWCGCARGRRWWRRGCPNGRRRRRGRRTGSRARREGIAERRGADRRRVSHLLCVLRHGGRGLFRRRQGAREIALGRRDRGAGVLAWRTLRALRRERGLGRGADDFAFDQNVVRAADHNKMFDIIAPDQNQAAAGVDGEGVENTEPGLAVAARIADRKPASGQAPYADKRQHDQRKYDAKRHDELHRGREFAPKNLLKHAFDPVL
jgi:hypothetical protein